MNTYEKPMNRSAEAHGSPEMNEILEQLKKPFHPTQIIWKPGALNGERNRALALAYADLRAYQNRLDEVCGLDWSVTYTPWSDRIVCHLTIHGVTRSSTGEPDSQSERSEIAGTAAEAQAFKRACAMFGLGRYLYNLPSVWVEYDGNSRTFSERAKARLEMLIHQHYRRTMGEASSELQPNSEAPAEVPTGEGEQPAVAAEARSERVPPGREGGASEMSQPQREEVPSLAATAEPTAPTADNGEHAAPTNGDATTNGARPRPTAGAGFGVPFGTGRACCSFRACIITMIKHFNQQTNPPDDTNHAGESVDRWLEKSARPPHHVLRSGAIARSLLCDNTRQRLVLGQPSDSVER